MNRPQLPLIAAAAAVLIGVGGFIGGTLPQSSVSGASTTVATGIVIGGAYVREPATPGTAAAYFTVYNNTGKPDVLTTVSTGAGEEAAVHIEVDGVMQLSAAGLTVPAHSSVVLTPGKAHVMIQKLYGTLLPGQTVNLELTFANAGTILVTAPVIAILAPAPTAASK
jgi:copper(I)-binding protein